MFPFGPFFAFKALRSASTFVISALTLQSLEMETFFYAQSFVFLPDAAYYLSLNVFLAPDIFFSPSFQCCF